MLGRFRASLEFGVPDDLRAHRAASGAAGTRAVNGRCAHACGLSSPDDPAEARRRVLARALRFHEGSPPPDHGRQPRPPWKPPGETPGFAQATHSTTPSASTVEAGRRRGRLPRRPSRRPRAVRATVTSAGTNPRGRRGGRAAASGAFSLARRCSAWRREGSAPSPARGSAAAATHPAVSSAGLKAPTARVCRSEGLWSRSRVRRPRPAADVRSSSRPSRHRASSGWQR